MLDLISKPPETYFGTQDAGRRSVPIKPHAGVVASVTDDLRFQRAGVCLVRRHLLRDVGGIPGEELPAMALMPNNTPAVMLLLVDDLER